MISELRSILHAVREAPDLATALDLIVVQLKQVMEVDVCSVYLRDFEREQLVLLASDGLLSDSVGVTRLAWGEGLVGWVAQRAEPVNLEDAASDTHYSYRPETGERPFHGFIGVPILRDRQVVGVLVVQQRANRRFSEDELDLMLTLAVPLATAIGNVETHEEVMALRESQEGSSTAIVGLSGAPGVALGQAVVVYPPAELSSIPDRPPFHVGEEVEHFRSVVESARKEVETLGQQMDKRVGPEERAVFDAYAAMASSAALVNGVVERIEQGNWAPGALRDTIQEHMRLFESMDDPYLRERACDLDDIGRLLLTHLQSAPVREFEYPGKTVLVGEDISVMQLAAVPEGHCVGLISTRGSGFSHIAILTRSMGIPAVMGVPSLPVSLVEGSEVIVDGYTGRVYLEPSDLIKEEFSKLIREEKALSAELSAARHDPSVTTDGKAFPVCVNAGLQADVASVADSGAQGVGLYRTEFPFMVRDRFPGEEEQFKLYRKVLEASHPHKAVLRTLDVGGDKQLSYLEINEDNPFLGWRGVRVMLDHPEIFLLQIRAMIRANQGLGNLRLMFPMVADVPQLNDALRLVEQARRELEEENGRLDPFEIGVMIEVPSAVYEVEALAERVDFLSVGTNDLTQYLLAVDRNNERVARFYDHLHPAVLRALRFIVEGAEKHKVPVSICGEMAEDPAAVPLLLGLGVDSLSMSSASVPRIKWMIRRFSAQESSKLLSLALSYHDVDAIRFLMNGALEELNLGGLIHAGR